MGLIRVMGFASREPRASRARATYHNMTVEEE